MKSFSLDTPEPPRPIDDRTKRKSNSTNTCVGGGKASIYKRTLFDTILEDRQYNSVFIVVIMRDFLL